MILSRISLICAVYQGKTLQSCKTLILKDTIRYITEIDGNVPSVLINRRSMSDHLCDIGMGIGGL